MIDKKYQGRGYGKAALLSGISYMKEHHNIKELYTGVIPNNEVAKKLYQFVGFMNTDLFENGMDEMKLILKDDTPAKVSNLTTTT